MNQCQFDEAWRGKCKAPTLECFCDKHVAMKCSSCGAQATHDCSHTGQFVCGAPLCANCEGYTDTSQPSGGWGFANHTHRPKVAAKETPQ